jgi:hypothetical protein
MSKQLYEEALADVKKLKEIAEDNAKRSLIEAISPRIKDLIETELLREAGELDDELMLDDEPLPFAAGDVDPSVIPALSPPDEEGKVTLDLDAINVQPLADDSVEFELSNESINLLMNPLVNKLNSATNMKIEAKLFRLDEAVQKFLEASSTLKKTVNYQHRVLEMVSKIEKTYEYLQESVRNLQDKGVYEGKLESLYKKLNKLVEQYNMKNNLKSLTEAEINLKLTNVPDELEDQLGDLGVDLVASGGEEDEEEDEGGDEEGDEELDLGSDEEDSTDDDSEEATEEGHQMETRRLRNNLVVEIDENMLRREISRMRTLREADETKPQSWGNGAGDLGDLEDEDLGDPLLDIELSEAQDQEVDEADELDEGQGGDEGWWKLGIDSGFVTADEAEKMREADDQGQKQQGQQKQMQGQQKQMQGQQKQQGYQMQGHQQNETDDQQDEADEKQEETQQVQEARRQLTREARVQDGAKKKAQSAKKQQREAQQKVKQKQQEVQQKLKQKKQLEAQKAKQEAQKQSKQAKKMQEAYVFYANIFNESVRRTAKLQSVLLAESRKVIRHNGVTTRSTAETLNLRKKLAETNLFNMKLLYCNKLLQNESLTRRQKAEIIEQLDETSSTREVKLVYETLIKTLARSSRQMSEGNNRQIMGSSSQATRPASTVLSENVETDRWARLAGLK